MVCVITVGYDADTSDSFSPSGAVDVCYGITSSPIREPVWLVIGPSTDVKSAANARKFRRGLFFWQADLGGMPLSDAAVRTALHAIVDTEINLLTGHTTDVKSIASSLSGATTTLSTRDHNGQPRRHVFCPWCRVREGCQLGWHLLLRADRDRHFSTPWPFVELGSDLVSR